MELNKPNASIVLSSLGYTRFSCMTEATSLETLKFVSMTTTDEDGNVTEINPLTHTWVQIKTKWDELQAEYDAQEYARNRAADYPDMGAQFNKIYDDGLTKWKAEMVDPVKTKWPKDNSGPVE